MQDLYQTEKEMSYPCNQDRKCPFVPTSQAAQEERQMKELKDALIGALIVCVMLITALTMAHFVNSICGKSKTTQASVK